MVEHEDGSITLTAHEFKVCHNFCELSAKDFKALLTSKHGVELSVDDVVTMIQRRVLLEQFEPSNTAQ